MFVPYQTRIMSVLSVESAGGSLAGHTGWSNRDEAGAYRGSRSVRAQQGREAEMGVKIQWAQTRSLREKLRLPTVRRGRSTWLAVRR